jgi:bifunctional isochorismate lyase / aryl carrier protein
MSCLQPSYLDHARHRELPPLQNCALLLIDWQRAFLEPEQRTFLPDAPRALESALALLRGFEAAHRPVIITRHAHRERPASGGMGSWWASFLMDQEPASACVEPIRAYKPAVHLRKSHYSAFRRTSLRRRLQSLGIEVVVIAGVMTHICVDSTARDAFMRGFDVVVAHDACASKDRRLHEASLLTLSHAVARVQPTRRILAALAEGRRA